jgi:hypothetical protein
MSDFKIPNTYTVLSNLTFFSPQQVPLGLKILDLNLNQQEKELLECNLILQASPEVYQVIDESALFNLNSEFRIPLSQKSINTNQDTILKVSLQPELLLELGTKISSIEELVSFLEQLSQNEPNSPFLSTENWMGLSVTQGLEPDIYGYRSVWAYIKPSDMNEEALSNGRMSEIMNQFIEEQIKTNFAQIPLGGNNQVQAEVMELVKQLVNQGSSPQSLINSTKSKKSKSSRKLDNLISSTSIQASSSDFQAEITDLIKQLVDVSSPLEEEINPSSQQLFEVLVDFFQQDQWDFIQPKGETVLRSMFQGENGQWTCYAWVIEEKKRVAFYSICPVNVPEERRNLLSELVTRANYCLLMGNFEMDYSDGEIRFKTSIDVSGDRITFALLRQLIYTNVLTMDQYLPSIMAVIYGNATPEEAIAQIEN